MDYYNCNSLQVEGLALAPKKIVKGIPCFDESPYFFEHTSRQTLLSLATLADTVGWKQTALGIHDPYLREYVTDHKRDFFLSILEIKENDRVLDAGAGWGVTSARIARGFPSTKVYAFDKTLETLLFADQIKRQEHLDNMRIIQGDIINPPFETNFFDVVIMIGLLEWLGVSTQITSPRAAQVLALRRIHDILRPSGRLLIGIENRIGAKYIAGAPDDHTGLKFTNLMPRRLADFYMKLRNKSPYRTYTYSQQGYKKLLREGGFKDVTFYATYPDYRFPTSICDLNSAKEINPHRLAQMLPRYVSAVFANSFYIKVKK
jgi:SAM-dependent methyltransferase